MGTGASSAKRKAKKAAAAQYYAEFAKLKSVPEMERMSTRNSRELEDAIGDNASGQTKNITRKIDRMSREINKDDEYKKNVRAYNDRYEILQNQIANKDTVRYSVSGAPAAEQSATGAGFGFVESNRFNIGNQNQAGPMAGGWASLNQPVGPMAGGWASLNQPVGMLAAINGGLNFGQAQRSKYNPNENYYKTKEEAMAAAQKRMEEYNAGLKDAYMNQKPEKGRFGTIMFDKSPQAAERYAQQNKVTDPSRFIQENKFGAFNVLYRDLSKAEDAVADVEALGKKVMNTKTNQLLPQYEKLNERLKGLVKRDARNVQPGNQNQSMVSNELASGKPYTETL